MQSSRGPPNLIYDRAPAEAVYDNLQLTNLNSGASHRATNVILQNVFQAWYQGPRKARRRPLAGSKFYVGKEVGIVDVDISRMEDAMNWTLYLQAACLLVQLTLSLVLGCLGWSLEVFITYVVTLAAQGLLITAITPRVDAWDFRDLTRRKVAPVMLHMGMDTTSALFVRCATKDGKTFSLEEYSWESQTVRDPYDTVQLVFAGFSFCIFAFQLILISWMSTESRLLFLILGFAGLVTNALEGAVEPPWDEIFKFSFEGAGFCEPDGGSLVSALGVLIGGGFAAGDSAAKLLYPDNKRLRRRLSDLRRVVAPVVCQNCSTRVRMRTDDQCLRVDGQLCCTRLRLMINESEVQALQEAKAIKDALATLSHFLRIGTEEEELPRIQTQSDRPSYDTYDWQKEK